MKKQLLALTLLATAVSLNAQNPYPIIPIDTLQFVNQTKLTAVPANDVPDYINPNMQNSTYRDTVRFEGVVVSNPKTYGLSNKRKAVYVQRLGGGPWSGVLVMCNPSATPTPNPTLPNFITETKFYENMVPGYKVRVTGKYDAFQGETQMNLIRNNANFSNAVEQADLNTYQPVYTVITADSLMTGNPTAGTWVQKKAEGEKWEGVLVELKNVVINAKSTFQNGTRWNWSVIDAYGNQIDVRDMSAYFRNDDNEDTIPFIANDFAPLPIGTVLSSLKGVISEYQVGGISRYGITPMTPGDVIPCTVCPPTIGLTKRAPVVATQNDAITITASVLSDTTVNSARVFYVYNKNYNFMQVSMTKNPDDTWSGTIPAQPADSIIRYYIQATNDRGLTSVIQEEKSFLIVRDGLSKIAALQYAINPANGASVWNGDSLAGINVTGVVTATGMNNQTIIQDGQGVNSAIFIQNSAGNAGWKIGDSVKITAARVTENFNVTTLYNVTGSVLKSNAVLPAFEMGLPIDSFRLNNVRFARPWEGVLVKWDSVYVIALNADSNANGDNFGEFTFNTDSSLTVGLRVDDLNAALLGINRTLTKGQMLSYLQGPMTFAFSNFKMIPRGLYDLGLCSMDTVKPVILASATDTVFVGSGAYMPTNISASDNKDGDLTSYIVTTGTINTSALGSYPITCSVSDFCGNMSDAVSRTVIVKDTPNTGLSSKEVVAANINVYPNPAINEITISANDVKSLPLTVAVYDMIGREMLTRTYNDKNVNETINISNFNNGIYFIVMKNQQGTHSIKFVVTGK